MLFLLKNIKINKLFNTVKKETYSRIDIFHVIKLLKPIFNKKVNSYILENTSV